MSLVTAIFLMVVLAMLGAFMLSVTGIQQASFQLDVQGARAFQAARAGIEWGAWQVLDPNNAQNPVNCGPPPAMPACPGATNLSGLAGSLSPFTVNVTCTSAATTEANREIRVFEIVATACNQPPCPSAAPASGYVERQVTATLSKCRDGSATPPRCECG